MQLEDAAAILSDADFFNMCTAEQRRILAFSAERRVLKKGDVLFRRGDVVDGAFVLMSGELLSTDDRSEADGSLISEYGAVIAELALLTKHPRRATIKAKSDAELLYVSRDVFMKLVEQYPDLADQVRYHVSSKLNEFVRPITNAVPKIKKR